MGVCTIRSAPPRWCTPSMVRTIRPSYHQQYSRRFHVRYYIRWHMHACAFGFHVMTDDTCMDGVEASTQFNYTIYMEVSACNNMPALTRARHNASSPVPFQLIGWQLSHDYKSHSSMVGTNKMMQFLKLTGSLLLGLALKMSPPRPLLLAHGKLFFIQCEWVTIITA